MSCFAHVLMELGNLHGDFGCRNTLSFGRQLLGLMLGAVATFTRINKGFCNGLGRVSSRKQARKVRVSSRSSAARFPSRWMLPQNMFLDLQ